jgi:ribosomal protein S20
MISHSRLKTFYNKLEDSIWAKRRRSNWKTMVRKVINGVEVESKLKS